MLRPKHSEYRRLLRREEALWQEFQPKFERLEAKELRQRAIALRQRAKTQPLDSLLDEALALARRAAEVTLRLRPRTNQVAAAIAVHEGAIIELDNGEGKTLVAALAAYVSALSGKGVHLATYNDYLAKRDAEWMGPLFTLLEISVGVRVGLDSFRLITPPLMLDDQRKGNGEIKHSPADAQSFVERPQLAPCTNQEAYSCDVTYGPHSDFVMDYLHDHLARDKKEIAQRDLNHIILDEADSALVDLARTPCSVVVPVPRSEDLYKILLELAQLLSPASHYAFDPLRLTEDGLRFAEVYLAEHASLHGGLYSEENPGVAHQLMQSLRALHIYRRGVDYGVEDELVRPIDGLTGRYTRGKFTDGIQQALEAKEGVPITAETQARATISFQHFFILYPKMSGLTATAVERAEEFHDVYGLNVIEIPPHHPCQRKHLNDFVFKTREEKFPALIQEVRKEHALGRPVLIGTQTMAEAIEIGEMLAAESLPCRILHADTQAEEARIIEAAGRKGAITVSAKIAGRGTDIVLDDEAVAAGGLFVIGAERNQSRHMDRQLAGRAARQGKPGSFRFYLSFEDDLMQNFGAGERMTRVMERFGIEKGQELEHTWLNQSVAKAQRRVEKRNFNERKQAYEYDGVLDKQRRRIYSVRQRALRGEPLEQDIDVIVDNAIERSMRRFFPLGKRPQTWDFAGFRDHWCGLCRSLDPCSFDELKSRRREGIRRWIRTTILSARHELAEESGQERMGEREARVLVSLLSQHWQEHLGRLRQFEDEMYLQAQAYGDTLVWYALQSNRAFLELIEEIELQFLQRDLNADSEAREREQEMEAALRDFFASLELSTVAGAGPPEDRGDETNLGISAVKEGEERNGDGHPPPDPPSVAQV